METKKSIVSNNQIESGRTLNTILLSSPNQSKHNLPTVALYDKLFANSTTYECRVRIVLFKTVTLCIKYERGEINTKNFITTK